MAEKDVTGRRILYFGGKSCDAEKLLIKIFRQAKESITVIDNRLSLRTLELLGAAGNKVPVLIYSDNVKGPEMLTRAGMKTFLASNPPFRLLIGTVAGKRKDVTIILDSDTPEEKVYLLSDSVSGTEDACILRKQDTGFVKELLQSLQENPYLILK